MSLKNNIIEKLYNLLNEAEISSEQIDKSEDFILAHHYDELKVANFINEYFKFESVEELSKTAITQNISLQSLILATVINFLTNHILKLPTKEERLEIFLDLTSSFKLIYESFYEALIQ